MRLHIPRAVLYRSPEAGYHLLVGEDGMSHDALFQLGIAPLDASQTEETFGPRTQCARTEAVFLRVCARRKGNSAKALILRAGSAVVLSKP
jgi:hypothetical protein